MIRELFRPIHPPDTLEKNLGPEQYKGVIDPVEAAKVRLIQRQVEEGADDRRQKHMKRRRRKWMTLEQHYQTSKPSYPLTNYKQVHSAIPSSQERLS